jgi:hypothetical protein
MQFRFAMCAWAGAPFPLQTDAFSGHDALNFNRPISQIASNQAFYENSVNAQVKNSPRFRHLFAVAKMNNPPYCWEALRNEN